ncbi:hypothetical protein Ancab_035833 [Ancistrocladus abbreviatus]
MKETLRYLTGVAGPSGYGSKSTADQVIGECSSSIPPHLTAIITGATSGIGTETARVLAKTGVRIIIPARNMKKAIEVKESIQRESPEAEIIIFEIDLSSFASIKRFCSEFLSLGLPLNILMSVSLFCVLPFFFSGSCYAVETTLGVFSQKLEFSDEKIEMTFATNYLGHFLLTEMLLDKMVETAEQTCIQGRIINISSVIHRWIKRDSFSFNQNLSPKCYNGTRAYAQTKLANIMHAKELARQLKARKARVTINAVHPGIVKTGIIRAHKGFITDSIYFLASKLFKTTSQGAATTCYVALSPKIEGISGRYFADCNESYCSTLANDEYEAQQLWKQTRALIRRRLHPPSL